jgi:hypothetical protein
VYISAGALALTVLMLVNQMSDVSVTRKAFVELKSVHADVVSSNGTVAAFDFVGTTKMRETLPDGVQIIWIVPNVWESVNGAWRKLPVHGGFQTAAQYVRNFGLLTETVSAYAATNLGNVTLNGQNTRKYRLLEKATGRTVDIWIGENHLPVMAQGQARRGGATMTITYSQFNRVTDIVPPM